MTLFESISKEDSLFRKALVRFFDGKRDEKTHFIIEQLT
jgi:uncharacterized protein (DUF1810 family)